MTTPEGLLKQKVKRYLDGLPRMYRYMPVPSGYGIQSLDFLCCIDGRFVGIETKSPGRKPTPRQIATMEAIKKAGGAAFWCDSFESFMVNMACWGLTPTERSTVRFESTARGMDGFAEWESAQRKPDWK